LIVVVVRVIVRLNGRGVRFDDGRVVNSGCRADVAELLVSAKEKKASEARKEKEASGARTINTLPLLSTLRSKSRSWEGRRGDVDVAGWPLAAMDMDVPVSSPSPSRLREGEGVVAGTDVDADAADVRVVDGADGSVDITGCDVDVDVAVLCRSRSAANSALNAATVFSASCSRRAMATICDMGGGFS
jgi:hypothetical protein